MKTNKISTKIAITEITIDVESSIRHWAQVKINAEIGANSSADPKRISFRKWEAAIAKAALAQIKNTGRPPRSIVLNEAAQELGVIRPIEMANP
jgi:hypothetical protein